MLLQMISGSVALRQAFIAISVDLLAIGAGAMFGWVSPALVKIRRGETSITLTAWEESWVVTSAHYGSIIGPILGGLCMDRFGRQRSISIFNLVLIIGWLMLALVTSGTLIGVARLLGGINAGALFLILPIYIAELFPARIRGTVTASYSGAFYLGTFIPTAIAPSLSYGMFIYVSTAIPVALLIVFLFSPETPYYLLLNGKMSKAEEVVEWIEGTCPGETIKRMQEGIEEQLKDPTGFLDILRDSTSMRSLVIVFVLGAVQKMTGMALLISYSTTFLRDSFLSVDYSTMLLNFSWFVASVIQMPFSDKFGRRASLFYSCLGIVFTMGGTAIYFAIFPDKETSSYNWLPLILMVLHGVVHSGGLASITSVMAGELFTMKTKAKCSVVTNISRSLFSTVSNQMYYPITMFFGLYMNFVVAALSGLLGLIFGYFYLPETRKKTLEQIQNQIKSIA